MENIRIIKEKIKSCLSCDEDQCPIIKERLERHVLSHHSSSRQTVSGQQTKPSGSYSSKSAFTKTTSDEQTSTSDLITEQLNKRSKRAMYKQRLEEVIKEWAKLLPKYPSDRNENLKEEFVNELIDKLANLYSEANEGYYDLKLSMEIDKFMESLPSMPDTQSSDLANLKEILEGIIGDLNKKIINKDMGRLETKDNSQNTLQSFNNNFKYFDTQSDETSTLYGSLNVNNESKAVFNLKEKPKVKMLVDAQVQPSFSSFKPIHGKMLRKPIYKNDKHQNTDVLENVYKQIISNWLNYLTVKLDQNKKIIITDAVLNRLKPLLNKKYTKNHKILLKAEILNCLNDYMKLISSENYSHINKISDELALNLLDAKIKEEEVNTMLCRPFSQNSKDKMLPMNFESENYFGIIVQNIVSEKIGSLNISNLIKRDIINIILQNMKLICMGQDHYIEALIFDILQHHTEFNDYCISNIVKSILDQIRIVATNNYLQIYNSLSNYDNYKLYIPSLISVYKSEHEILNSNSMPIRSKSSDSNYSQLTEDERTYIDNISELIKAWMIILPTNSSNTMSMKTKEGIIKNLAQDILDQVKLEQIVLVTNVEKDKYLSFFIHRWLKRNIRFENISDAQPYAEKLIEKLKNIPTPSIYKNQTLSYGIEILTPSTPSSRIEYNVNHSQTNDKDQNIANTLKSGAILKEFIAKYIEHNYDEDNPITGEVFGHILKTELQKLSTPTRKKVYDDFYNQVNNIITSEKIAKELQYINIISDWYQVLPLDSLFNVTGNKQRAQYVNDLAKIISDLEENRLLDIDYNKHLKSTVTQFMEDLPITKSYSHDMSFLIDELIDKIASLRSSAVCAFERDLSLNVSRIPDQNLSDFIEAYIRENSNEIANDELKLDAWALRLLEEVDNMASENPSALCTTQVYNRLADISEQGDDIGKRFNLKLSYAKEISNWLNNLPLQRIIDKSAKDLRIQMISNLAEKMSARLHLKNLDPNNTQVDVDLEDYIEKWIKELSLDRNKELSLPLLTQQLLKRMEKVNTSKQTLPLIQQQQQEPQNVNSKIYNSPYCNKQNTRKLKTLDPGGAIVEAIESWCQHLPIQSESESNNNSLKEEFSTKLYKKVDELNKNPDYFNNNFLYLQILEEEIDMGLDELPQNPQLQNRSQKLKEQLLDIINENRNLISEKSAGVKYRQELAKNIEISLPNPGPLQPKHNPGFNIYKNRLAELFILDNFDHSQDNAKFIYLKRLRYDLDKYFAQNMNSLPLTKEQMFNELYSSLFFVPPPNETSIVDEVEEVKTKCEIESWFEGLPIRKATGLDELFEWDQILFMLAKRLHYMEKYEKNYDDNIFKEISKWLLKLPILSGQEENMNHFANDLQQRLKSTFNDRMCKLRDPNMPRESILNKNTNKGVLGTSEVAGPSSEGMPWLSLPLSPVPKNPPTAPKRPSDLILDIVETWCQQLPLSEKTQQEKDNAKLLKDNLVAKIIMKINELNFNSETFENDILYDVILDDELENLISTLPTSNALIQNKRILKNQLIDAIKSIKPLVTEEKARYAYKQELKNTVDQVLEQPPISPPEKVALLITLRDEIIDNFVAYRFCKGDEKGQEVHKTMVHNAVENYYIVKKRTNSDDVVDPLIKVNQLLCELAKIPTPSNGVILEEIYEIRMKFEISDLFKELSFTDDENKLALKNQVKSTLARRLTDFNRTSFIQNRDKVRDDIMKCLHKIQNEINPQKVELFIKKLENSENRRISQLSANNNNNFPTSYKAGEQFTNNKNVEDEQWLSLLPATPRVRDPNYHDSIEFREIRKSLGEVGSPQVQGQAFDRSISQSGISYDKFKEGELLPSSVLNNYQPIQSLSKSNDKPGVVPDQSQNISVGPYNGAIGRGYGPIDDNANRPMESSLRRRDNFNQPKNLESHNVQRRDNFNEPQNLESQNIQRRDNFNQLQNLESQNIQRRDNFNQLQNLESQNIQRRDNFNQLQNLESQNIQRRDNFNQLQNLESQNIQRRDNFNQLQNLESQNIQRRDNFNQLQNLESQNIQRRDNFNQLQNLESHNIQRRDNLNQPQNFESPNIQRRDNFNQPQNLESHNIQPKFTQQVGGRANLQKTFNSPQPRNPDSQEPIRSQNRRGSYTFINNPQNPSSHQSGYTPNLNQNQMSISATKPNSDLPSSQITLKSQGSPFQQNQYGTPSSSLQTPTLINIPGPSAALPSDLLQPMPQFSSQTPYCNSRCNKSCRRPPITLFKPPETQCNKNQMIRCNVRPISDDDEIICLCTNKRKRQCRGSPNSPVHMRKQCKICNGVNPFNCPPPYRRYCRY